MSWRSNKGSSDGLVWDLLRQALNAQPSMQKGKGKGKAKGADPQHGPKKGLSGIDLSRPLQPGQPLYAGRTTQEAKKIITDGGWVGNRQFLEYRGKIYTSLRREGDVECTRCHSGTCRHFRSDCWVCGAQLPGGGGQQETTRKGKANKAHKDSKPPKHTNQEGQGEEEEEDFLSTLPKAMDMDYVKKRPPSTAATVLAGVTFSASAVAPGTTETPSPMTPSETPPLQCPPPQLDGDDPDYLDGATLGQVKSLVAKRPTGSKEWTMLKEMLERHVAADSRRKRQGAASKAESMDFTGWTLEKILAHRETRVASTKTRIADNMERREREESERRKSYEQNRATLQKALDKATEQLRIFDEESARRTAEWEAAENARAADLQEQLKLAEEEVARATEAWRKAPAPNTKVGAGGSGENENGKGAGKPTGRDGDTHMDEGGADREHGKPARPPTRNHFQPMITPPKLQPPTDPQALSRLHCAQAVQQLWSVQDGDWPLTPAMLGLSVQEVAQLVGEAIWAKSPLVSEHAHIRKSMIGSIGVALNGLEVTAAAQAAAQETARKLMEAPLATAAATTKVTETDGAEVQQPPNKSAKTGDDIDDKADVDM